MGRDTDYAAGGDSGKLEAQIEATREQLASTIDAIADKVAPGNVAARAKSRAKNVVVKPDGSLKKDRVAIVGGIAVALVALVVWRRFH